MFNKREDYDLTTQLLKLLTKLIRTSYTLKILCRKKCQIAICSKNTISENRQVSEKRLKENEQIKKLFWNSGITGNMILL